MWKMRDDFMFVVVTAACLLALFFGSIIYGGTACANKAGAMQLKWRYGITTGCMIEYKPGKWIEINQYRVIE